MFYYTEITRNRDPWATWLPVPRGLLWRSTSVASKSKGVHFLASSGWQSTRPGMECEYCNIICGQVPQLYCTKVEVGDPD